GITAGKPGRNQEQGGELLSRYRKIRGMAQRNHACALEHAGERLEQGRSVQGRVRLFGSKEKKASLRRIVRHCQTSE
ncbi:hypothetical protein ACC725_38565, partial [Rhizobium ruizarguesonis]